MGHRPGGAVAIAKPGHVFWLALLITLSLSLQGVRASWRPDATGRQRTGQAVGARRLQQNGGNGNQGQNQGQGNQIPPGISQADAAIIAAVTDSQARGLFVRLLREVRRIQTPPYPSTNPDVHI